MDARGTVALLVLLALPAAGVAGDCLATCAREAAACQKRAAADVAECRATVRERCSAACGCEAMTGAEATACAQRCQVCKDMLREGAGLDCDRLEQDRADECGRARATCERRCKE